MDSDKRVLIGMSGGIDSSAACMILQEQEYEVIGLTMRMWDLPRHFPNEGQTIPQFAIEAKELAEKIGIEHHILDVRDDFKRTVIKSFTDEYLKGNTPNPCVLCNKQFKWHYLLQEADRLNCQWVATGHYARISRKNNRFILNRGADPKKASILLFVETRTAGTCQNHFPVRRHHQRGNKTIRREKGFHEKVEKKESMEVCFIPGDYRDFLREQLPDLDREVTRRIFYRCRRTEARTAQRIPILYHRAAQRIGDSFGEAMFVTRINPIKNTIRLGERSELLTRNMVITDVIETIPGILNTSEPVDVQIRYRSAAIPATLRKGETPNEWIVCFQSDASAVTPGQSAVIYQNDCIIGGGIIADQRLLKKYAL